MGDTVILSTAHLKLRRPTWNLDYKFIGPFQIPQLIPPTAVRLTLPHRWKTHPTFHIAVVKPFVPGNCPVEYKRTEREYADIEVDKE